MTENLARVPFIREDEETIISMARWMRFIAVIGIVAGILMLIALVIAAGLLAAVHNLGDNPQWAKPREAVMELGTLIYFLMAVFLVAAIATLWQNFALYHAGDYFALVARTDDADVDNLAYGLDRLRVYFKIQVMVMVITVAVAFGTALVVAAAVARPAA